MKFPDFIHLLLHFAYVDASAILHYNNTKREKVC